MNVTITSVHSHPGHLSSMLQIRWRCELLGPRTRINRIECSQSASQCASVSRPRIQLILFHFQWHFGCGCVKDLASCMSRIRMHSEKRGTMCVYCIYILCERPSQTTFSFNTQADAIFPPFLRALIGPCMHMWDGCIYAISPRIPFRLDFRRSPSVYLLGRSNASCDAYVAAFQCVFKYSAHFTQLFCALPFAMCSVCIRTVRQYKTSFEAMFHFIKPSIVASRFFVVVVFWRFLQTQTQRIFLDSCGIRWKIRAI